jgi:hypothetical protein
MDEQGASFTAKRARQLRKQVGRLLPDQAAPRRLSLCSPRPGKKRNVQKLAARQLTGALAPRVRGYLASGYRASGALVTKGCRLRVRGYLASGYRPRVPSPQRGAGLQMRGYLVSGYRASGTLATASQASRAGAPYRVPNGNPHLLGSLPFRELYRFKCSGLTFSFL